MAPTPPPQTDAKVAVLFARQDSIYKRIAGCDVYDMDRDARTYDGPLPVVAHPPCRAWGRLRRFANPRPDERNIARLAVALVREFGGVLEHPAGSLLWPSQRLPLPGQRDSWGGVDDGGPAILVGAQGRQADLALLRGMRAAQHARRSAGPWRTVSRRAKPQT